MCCTHAQVQENMLSIIRMSPFLSFPYLDKLAEDRDEILRRVWKKLPQMNLKRLRFAVKRFDKLSIA